MPSDAGPPPELRPWHLSDLAAIRADHSLLEDLLDTPLTAAEAEIWVTDRLGGLSHLVVTLDDERVGIVERGKVIVISLIERLDTPRLRAAVWAAVTSQA